MPGSAEPLGGLAQFGAALQIGARGCPEATPCGVAMLLPIN
jgi:hypothetical protein